MDIVIDTSAIIAVVADEPDRLAILTATRDVTLRAPRSVHWEIGNAFSAMIKQRRITKDKALKAVALYQRIPIAYTDVALEQSLMLASRYNIYAYDAYVLACAQQHGLPLLSLDAALLKTARAMDLDVVNL